MQRSVLVIFDGEVLRPEEPLDLKRNGRYLVTIEEPDSESTEAEAPGMLDDLRDLITDFGVSDLAAQHDHYLYGTPKR
ncbi:MAG: hypothetical protein ACRDJE_05780 [Dehalococcoidia bacterium]